MENPPSKSPFYQLQIIGVSLDIVVCGISIHLCIRTNVLKLICNYIIKHWYKKFSISKHENILKKHFDTIRSEKESNFTMKIEALSWIGKMALDACFLSVLSSRFVQGLGPELQQTTRLLLKWCSLWDSKNVYQMFLHLSDIFLIARQEHRFYS